MATTLIDHLAEEEQQLLPIEFRTEAHHRMEQTARQFFAGGRAVLHVRT